MVPASSHFCLQFAFTWPLVSELEHEIFVSIYIIYNNQYSLENSMDSVITMGLILIGSSYTIYHSPPVFILIFLSWCDCK